MYIDIHTHNTSNKNDVLEIRNCFLGESLCSDECFSLGLHPWHISEKSLGEVEKFYTLIENNNFLALGEIGLDKNIDVSLEFQKQILELQLVISEENNLPVVLHVVRSFNDILELRKKGKYKQPWIIHGFNKNKELAKQLLAKGFYLSLGAKVMRNDIIFAELVKAIDISKLFLETDDQSEFTIKDIYKRVAEIKEISEKELVLLLEHNFKKVFTRYNG